MFETRAQRKVKVVVLEGIGRVLLVNHRGGECSEESNAFSPRKDYFVLM